MANGRFGSFDPTITTRFGPTGMEEAQAVQQGIDRGLAFGNQVVNMAIQGQRLQRDRERTAQLQELRDMQQLKQHRDMTEGWNITTKDTLNPFRTASAEAMGKLVDVANDGYIKYKEGKINRADYLKLMTVVDNQLPLYRAMNDSWSTQTEKVLALNDADKISNTNKPKDVAVYLGIANGTIPVSYETTDDGQIVMKGEYDNPFNRFTGKKEKINIPVSQLDKMPTIRAIPENTAFEVMETEANSLIQANKNISISQGELDAWKNKKGIVNGKVNEALKPVFEKAFDEYYESLGEGDALYQMGQYILDAGADNNEITEAMLTEFTKKQIGIGEELSVFKGKDTMGTLEAMMNWTDGTFEEQRALRGRFDVFKKALKDNFVQRMANVYDNELMKESGMNADQIAFDSEQDRADYLKTQSDITKNKANIVKYNKEIKEIKSPKKDGPKYNIEEDLSGLISNLTGGEGEVENLVRALVKSPESGEVVDQLSKFNLKANTTQKDNPEKGGDPIKGVQISGPGMKPIDFYGTDFTDITNLAKELLYGQSGISRKDKDAIWNRLTDKFKL